MARHQSGRLYEPIGDNCNRRCVSADTKRSVVTSEVKSRKIGESYRKTTLFCFGGIAVKPVDTGNNETLYKLRRYLCKSCSRAMKVALPRRRPPESRLTTVVLDSRESDAISIVNLVSLAPLCLHVIFT